MKRFGGCLMGWTLAGLLAIPMTASAHHHGAAHHARHRTADPIFQRGGGPAPVVRATDVGLRHERVAHRNAGTAGIHYHSVHTR